MSSTLPPHGPSSDGAERLATGAAGAPAPHRARRGLVVGGAVVAVAGLVGGAWAVASFLGTGPQPSEALPASTLGYVAVDLDPGGEQKLEALRMLRKFPGFRESVDLGAHDDVRRELFETFGETDCDIDYDEEVEPWLGARAALAAVPGGDEPTPVAVLQVSDAEAAQRGLAALRECGEGEQGLAWAVEGDWAVLAPSPEAAREVVDQAAEATLADDPDFIRWGSEIGEPGVVTMYAGPEAGAMLADLMEEAAAGPEPGADAFGGEALQGLAPGRELPAETRRQLEAFEGGSATLRFADGGVELEVATAADEEALKAYEDVEAGGDAVRRLPADTAAALGFGLPGGWSGKAMTELEAAFGPVSQGLFGMPFDQLEAMAEQQSGLSLPEDIETLLGESLALAVGGDFSLEAAEESPDGSDVPVGVTVIGDGEGIRRVLDTLDQRLGAGAVIGHDVDVDTVAIGPDADYRRRLLEEGGLGEAERFTDVVAGADRASAVLFVDFDAAWVTELARLHDDEVVRNLEPLAGLGFSSRVQDGTVRMVLRLGTD